VDIRLSVLGLFNFFVPKDKGVRRLAVDVAYGPHPRQRYDVYAPRQISARLPMLVFFYGGGWSEGGKAYYAWMGHALAALGYVVIVPDYRLVPQVLYPDFLNDCAEAVRHAVSKAQDYGADASRLAVMGHSAGAYNAAMLTLDPSYLANTMVSALVCLSGPFDFYPFDVKASRDTFSAWPRPLETQPVNHAHKVSTSVLILQSSADTVVGTHNAVNLEASLKATGNDVRLRLYERLSHQEMAAVFSIPFRRKAPVRSDVAMFLATSLQVG